MAKKIVFMTEKEVMEAVNQTTGGTESSLGFSEEWELDTVQIPVSSNQEQLNLILDTFTDREHIERTSTGVIVPVSSFIPAFSALLDTPLTSEVEVCECNLYEDEILYAFNIAS